MVSIKTWDSSVKPAHQTKESEKKRLLHTGLMLCRRIDFKFVFNGIPFVIKQNIRSYSYKLFGLVRAF